MSAKRNKMPASRNAVPVHNNDNTHNAMSVAKTAVAAPKSSVSAINSAVSTPTYAEAACSSPLPAANREISTLNNANSAYNRAMSTPKSAMSGSSSSAKVSEEDIPDNMVPPEICFPCYDILLLHCVDDLYKALEVKKHLETDEKFHMTEDPIQVLLYEELASTFNRQISCLREGMEHCTFVFILISKTFCECELSCFLEEECLMESIQKPERNWRIVPYFMDSKSEGKYKVPFGLQCLCAYYFHTRDEFYYSRMKEMVLKRRYIKVENEKKREQDIKKWKEDKRWFEAITRRMKDL